MTSVSSIRPVSTPVSPDSPGMSQKSSAIQLARARTPVPQPDPPAQSAIKKLREAANIYTGLKTARVGLREYGRRSDRALGLINGALADLKKLGDKKLTPKEAALLQQLVGAVRQSLNSESSDPGNRFPFGTALSSGVTVLETLPAMERLVEAKTPKPPK